MFTGGLIATAFIATFLSIFPIAWLEKRNYNVLVKTFLTIGLIASIYSILAGLNLLVGWEDPFVNVDPETIGKASAQSRGRGGLVILAIRFWPYVLIGAGGYFGWSYAVAIRRRN